MLQISHLPHTIQALFALSRIDTFESHTTLHFEPPEGGIFAASDSCFGNEIKKVHKAIQDKLRDYVNQIVQSLAFRCPEMINGGSPYAAYIIMFLRTHIL